ncbi:MAG: hypothetical protein LBT99_01440 [Bifidobacteriaceae bacterium]|jgi:hypothetical protein|nr:hypothetical protein [Bifidobacteriaceae bacterium]
MKIRKNNIEVRKNWNKLSFKKLGAILCLFLFGIVTFISGNLTQVNAATSSTVLPVAKGGTGNNIGNAPSANKLYNARNINLVTFDGTKDIDIFAPPSIGENLNYELNTTDFAIYQSGVTRINIKKYGHLLFINIDIQFLKFGSFGTIY